VGVIDPKTLTATLIGTVEKTYDGTTTASLAAGNYSLSGVIGSDNVSLNDPASGSYATANPGTGITVSVGGLALSGAQAEDYTVSPSTAGPVGVIEPSPTSVQPTAPATATVTELTTVDTTVQAIDPGSSAAAAGATAGATDAAGTKSHSSAVSVFPITSEPADAKSNIDSSPVTGGGNRDLWTGSDEGGQGCPTSSDPSQSCAVGKGAKP